MALEEVLVFDSMSENRHRAVEVSDRARIRVGVRVRAITQLYTMPPDSRVVANRGATQCQKDMATRHRPFD